MPLLQAFSWSRIDLKHLTKMRSGQMGFSAFQLSRIKYNILFWNSLSNDLLTMFSCPVLLISFPLVCFCLLRDAVTWGQRRLSLTWALGHKQMFSGCDWNKIPEVVRGLVAWKCYVTSRSLLFIDVLTSSEVCMYLKGCRLLREPSQKIDSPVNLSIRFSHVLCLWKMLLLSFLLPTYP